MQVVREHLSAALEEALRGPAAEAARALRDGAPAWTRNPTYAGRVDPAFLAGYAYAETARGDGVAEGVLLLGPGVVYPAHAHPATEEYTVWTSGAAFEVDGTLHADLPAGAVVQIPSGAVHAMRTGDRPLLARYRWTGDITQPARLVEA